MVKSIIQHKESEISERLRSAKSNSPLFLPFSVVKKFGGYFNSYFKSSGVQRMVALSAILFFNFTLFSQSNEGDKILGVWLTGSGKAHIRITKYGDNKYGGKIIWLKEPNRPDGSVKKDIKNPDKNKQSNTIMGLNNLLGFTYAGKKEYEGGSIYDPENGKTYKCVMTLDNDNTLKVRGYVGIQMLGRTDTWTRVTE